MPQPLTGTRSSDDSNAIILVVTLFTFGSALPISTINVALPEIAKALQLSATEISWVPLIFLLASVILVLPCGRLADIYGRMRVFKLSIYLVLGTAFATALAPSASWLLALRFGQGCAAAVGFVLLISIISSAVDKSSRSRAFGIIASAMYFGLTAGPLIAGYVTAYASWRATFLLHVPFMLVALAIASSKVKSEWQIAENEHFDWLGSAIYAVGVVLLTVGAIVVPASYGLALIAVGLIGLVAFVKQQQRRQQPLINITLFRRNKVFLYSCLASIFMYAANFSSLVLVSLYLQYIKGLPAELAGWVLMLNPLCTAFVTPFAGHAGDRFEPKYVATIGIILTALGLLILAIVSKNSPMIIVIIAMISMGVGFAFFAPVNAHAIMSSIGEEDYATGAGAHASVRLIGQLSSMVVVSMIFALVIGRETISPENYPELAMALQYSFSLAALVCIPACYYSINRGRILS
ncbi:MAG: MFS transporter [Gammaproteobacteria bacterium]